MKVYIFEVGHGYDAANDCNVYLFKRSALRAARRYMQTHDQPGSPWKESGGLEGDLGSWERVCDYGYVRVYLEPLRLRSQTSIIGPP